ncbi:unnamed protein product, partial [Musa textilis]
MDSVSPVTLDLNKEKGHCSNSAIVFDTSFLRRQAKIPESFVWPLSERPHPVEELEVPVVDLRGLFEGDEASISCAAEAVRAACVRHGFFQVINHKVDAKVSGDALDAAGEFFKLPLSTKLRARRQPGSAWGYVGAHADRFASKLPWKETLTFGYDYGERRDGVVDYFTSKLGEGFEPMGRVYRRYCEAMKELSLSIMELLGISLGVGREHCRQFFEDGSSIMRCNSYPPCQEPELALGTGPHCDPTALTILLQDQAGGLQVFTEGKWQAVRPSGARWSSTSATRSWHCPTGGTRAASTGRWSTARGSGCRWPSSCARKETGWFGRQGSCCCCWKRRRCRGRSPTSLGRSCWSSRRPTTEQTPPLSKASPAAGSSPPH